MSSIRTSSTTQSRTTMARRSAVALAATAVATAALATTVPAYAAGQGGRAVRANSTCAAGLVKFKAKTDTGGLLEVGGELNTDVSGQVWAVSIVDNGVTAWSDTRTTVAPTGAFGAAAVIPDLVGKDALTFTATSGTTTCTVSVIV